MKALIVVDMQVGSFTPETPRHDAEGVIARINALADRIRPDGLVVHIQHTEEHDGYARGSSAWELLPALQVAPSDEIVEKTACDSFLETRLEELLRERGVEDVMIVGCATDFCVDTTVRSAASHGFRVTAVSDGHTTADRPHLPATGVITHHNYMWESLQLPRQGRVRVAPTDILLGELGDGGTSPGSPMASHPLRERRGLRES
jgi:nicotinamidase-related amidase